MKVKFVTDAMIIVDGSPEVMFEQGDLQDLTPESAQRWIRRGVAVEVAESDAGELPAAKRKTAKASG